MLSAQHTTVDPALEGVLSMLAPDGTRRPCPDLDRWVADVTPEQLRLMHRDMIATRRIDREGVALQRQGELGLWAPAEGQEGVQIGTAHALRRDDFAFISYREHGVAYARGAQPGDFVSIWRAEEHSSYDPYAIGVSNPQIIIGAQTLHAVGYAMGIQRDALHAAPGTRADQAAVSYFGDGASSQGDVHEAMVFAASFGAPVVFVCSNNQWAISEPVALQSRTPIVRRAAGYGMAARRIDGNDPFVCLAAMREALQRARTGGGPSLIEAVTYRIGPHTTSDDPTRYRSEAEVDAWRRRDPIARLEAYLRSMGELSDAQAQDAAALGERVATEMRAACLSMVTKAPLAIFDHVYAQPHSGIAREREQYRAYLRGFDDAE
ncbi:MAG: pyruvate dehydrogenase (acetyl-transferring) E1 component subunit alpha [Microthrixaceae bacterium]|nr:pyruvate dehydrogenase (acetyl-transferring) E1 component subunit alpha [Microthrixaceae bacterium]